MCSSNQKNWSNFDWNLATYFVINFHSDKMWTVVDQKRALWLLWPLRLTLTLCLFPMTSRAAKATSVTPGQMRELLTEPVGAGSEDTACPHPRSELCPQNIPSRPTWASHRTASTLISLTREVSLTSFSEKKLSKQLLILCNSGIWKLVINQIN